MRRAFRKAAARHHPDKGGDAAAFDAARRAYLRLAEGLGVGNPLRDPDAVGRLLGEGRDRSPTSLPRSPDLDAFEARLLVVLLEQPTGLDLGSLRKRYFGGAEFRGRT